MDNVADEELEEVGRAPSQQRLAGVVKDSQWRQHEIVLEDFVQKVKEKGVESLVDDDEKVEVFGKKGRKREMDFHCFDQSNCDGKHDEQATTVEMRLHYVFVMASCVELARQVDFREFLIRSKELSQNKEAI